ncbi:MAG TPA: hypothetical protein VGJ05_21985 [Fimbriiglobus sp.]|jgi:hypothetical protein
MREVIDLRIPEVYASKYLLPSEGERLGAITRKIRVEITDPLYAKIKKIDHDFRVSGKSFVLGWDIRRKYSKKELTSATAFLTIITRTFEPAGEESGTVYDESTACEYCGTGATRKGYLILDQKRIPKQNKQAFAKTIAGEIIVSDAFVDIFRSNQLRGAIFRPVMQQSNPSNAIGNWFEPIIESPHLTIVPPTRCGSHPLDDGSELHSKKKPEIILAEIGISGSWCDRHEQYECPKGHTIGLNLLSELSVNECIFDFWDIAYTAQRVGVRRGLLRPESLMVISPRLWNLLEMHAMKGFRTEIVHTSHSCS